MEENCVLVKGRSFRSEIFLFFVVSICLTTEIWNWAPILPEIFLSCSVICYINLLWKVTVTKKEVIVTKYLIYSSSYPIDSISSTATTIFAGVELATSSKNTRAAFVTHAEQVDRVIKSLIQQRISSATIDTTFNVAMQGNIMPEQVTPNNVVENVSIKDSLKELKDLFDDGLLSEEEYNDKRKKLIDKL